MNYRDEVRALNRPGGYFRPFPARPRVRVAVRVLIHPADALTFPYGFVFYSRAKSERKARSAAVTAALRDAARRFPDAREVNADIVTISI